MYNTPTHSTNLLFQVFYNFTGVSKKFSEFAKLRGVDKVHKILYYKCNLCTLLLVYIPENLNLADAFWGHPVDN